MKKLLAICLMIFSGVAWAGGFGGAPVYNSNNVAITGGTIAGVVISPSSSTFDNSLIVPDLQRFGWVSGTSEFIESVASSHDIRFDITGAVRGKFTATGLNAAAIGATTPSTGAFTTLSTTGATTLAATVVTTVKTSGYTVAGLPAGTVGMRAYVSDQLTTCAVAGAALTGGGAVTCPVFYNGAAWVGD